MHVSSSSYDMHVSSSSYDMHVSSSTYDMHVSSSSYDMHVSSSSSKKSAEYYPQLLGKTVLINTPSFMRVVWSAFSVFMPKSALEKTTICPATGTSLPNTPDASTCPFIMRWCGKAGLDSVPDFLGGTMPCPDELKPRNECSNSLQKVRLNAVTYVCILLLI